MTPHTTPPEAKAAIVEAFSLPDMAIDENQNSASQSLMEEYEVPTAPPSPSLPPKLPDRPPPQNSDESHDSHLDRGTEDFHPHVIEADQGKCALCYLDCSDFSAYSRVAHMNRCWSSLLQRVKDDKDRQQKLADLQARLTVLIGRHKTRLQSGSSISDATSISNTSDVVETSDIADDSPAVNEAATSCLSIQPAIVSSLAEATTPTADPKPSKTTPSSPLPASIPRTSCLLCALSLTQLPPVNALAHRIYCLTFTDRSPTFCPICTADFHYPALWEKPDIIWHLHNCQNGGNLSPADRDDFDALVAAWMGLMEVVERAVVGKIDGRAGMRVSEYKKKRDEGWDRGEGWYASEVSKLRWGEMLVDEGVEVVQVIETWTPTWFREQRFRRGKFCVLRVPKDGRVFSRFKMQRVEKELVFDEEEEDDEEEIDDDVPGERAVPKWSLPSIYGNDRPSRPRRMAVGSAIFHDTLSSDDTAKAKSLPSIYDEEDEDEDEEDLEEIIRSTANRVSSEFTPATATDEVKTLSLPSLRPPPGLHRPFFSFADFEHILNAPEDSLESTYTADSETKSQDEETADDDATSDSSGSTISDHSMSDFYAAKQAAARGAADAAPTNEGEPAEHELQNFPSHRLEELPTVRFPPDPTTQTPEHDTHSPNFPHSLQQAVDVATAADFFSDAQDVHGETVVVLPGTRTQLGVEEQVQSAQDAEDECGAASEQSENAVWGDDDDTDAREDWVASRARAQAVLAGRVSPGSSSRHSQLLSSSTAQLEFPPSRVPNFLCPPELEDGDVETCYYYPPRGYLHENLRSSVVSHVSDDMGAEEVERRNRGVCVFGGADEQQDED